MGEHANATGSRELQFDISETDLDQIRTIVADRFPETGIHERKYFKLYKDYTKLLLEGEKTTTVRYDPEGIDLPGVKSPPLLVSSPKEGVESVRIGNLSIGEITIKLFENLDDADARADGFLSASELKNTLDGIYEINGRDFVTIYSIELATSREELWERFHRKVDF